MQELTFKKFDALWKEYNSLSESLVNDIFLITGHLEKSDIQTWRRLYVKSLVSVLEAQVFFLRSHTKLTGEIDDLGLSKEHELMLFKPKKRLSLLNDLIFSVELFSHANYSCIKVDKTSKGYSHLNTLIKVRNRITHPKQFQDINISDSEIKKCEDGFNSFQDILDNIMEKSAEALMASAQVLKKRIDALKNSS